jgi:diguanylate cyclase (GGDEF)-like protein
MGMVALSQALGDEYAAVLEKAAGDHAALRDHERQVLGLDHAEVGAALVEFWKLPPVIVAPIRHHEAPDGAGPEVLPLVQSVALGNRVADISLSADAEGASLETYYTQAKTWFGIPRDEAEPTLMDIHAETENLGNLFDVPTRNLGKPTEILAHANEALMHLTLQSQQENTQLINEVQTDALTGVAKRRALDRFVREQFERATPDSPTSVLFIDLDHFKRFSDTYGHALGDRVLAVFAETLRHTVGDQGTVFRYAGEEFTIVCPNTDRTTAATIAELVRRAVEENTKISGEGGDTLNVTCSIGVASHTGDTFESVEQLVYAAEADGRNGVRTHWPLGRSDATATCID